MRGLQQSDYTEGLAFERLLCVAAALGYLVDTYSPEAPGEQPNEDRMGYVNYVTRVIWIRSCNPVEDVIALLHELGHALAASRMGYGVEDARSISELEAFTTGEERAYLYGWAIGCFVKITGRKRLTRDLWRASHGYETESGSATQ